MKVKEHYEEYWSDRKSSFDDYERNLVLGNFFSAGEKVLDLGCGDGEVGINLEKRFRVKVLGVDVSERAVFEAKKRGLESKVFDIEKRLPFKDGEFDVCFWGDNIEHLFDPLSVAKEIKRVLKKDGRIVVSCPNMGYWRYRFFYFLNGRLPDTEWTGHKPWDFSHIRFFNLKILKEFLALAGFKNVIKFKSVSSRKMDKILIPISPSFFGMVLILEAK